MDVGNFIGELLAQRGEVNVPGLGYFARIRTNGRFNEREAKFYPPANSVQFDPQHVQDDTLVQYMSEKKNISLASSKYFTEKFITNLKLQAQTEDAPLADLGWFYTQESQLFFRPNAHIGNDPNFFGYEPLQLNKLGKTLAPAQSTEPVGNVPQEPVPPVAAVPVPPEAEEPADGYRFETDEEHEEYLTRLARRRSRRATITFVILALLFTALVVYLVNRYDPTIFRLGSKKTTVTKTEPVVNAKVVQEPDTTKATLPSKPDTDSASLKQNTAVKDTLATVSTADSLGYPHWEVMAASFKTPAAANKAIANYKTLGYTAHIVADATGPRVHVSLGGYKTQKEAADAVKKLKIDKRISKEIYPLEIRKKK